MLSPPELLLVPQWEESLGLPLVALLGLPLVALLGLPLVALLVPPRRSQLALLALLKTLPRPSRRLSPGPAPLGTSWALSCLAARHLLDAGPDHQLVLRLGVLHRLRPWGALPPAASVPAWPTELLAPSPATQRHTWNCPATSALCEPIALLPG